MSKKVYLTTTSKYQDTACELTKIDSAMLLKLSKIIKRIYRINY